MVFNIEKLAEKARVTRRAVRYYVQRGLLPPPEGKLKGAYYTKEHLKRLREIRRLSEQGVPLALMKEMLEREGRPQVEERAWDCEGEGGKLDHPKIDTTPPKEFESAAWTRTKIADGVELHVRGKSWSESRIAELAAAAAVILQLDGGEK